MKVLELFAGSRSISKEAEKLGMETFSTDIEQFGGIDYVVDILDFKYAKLPFIPDIIWASPPCTAFSVASMTHHWGGGYKAYKPKTKTARQGIKLVERTVEIIDFFMHPGLIFYVENPRGILRKLDLFHTLPAIRHTVTYCQYGDTRMKPTDIWTNNIPWRPRLVCKNGDPCHERAPRGCKTGGTQGMSNAYDRAKIPRELCNEVLTNV